MGAQGSGEPTSAPTPPTTAPARSQRTVPPSSGVSQPTPQPNAQQNLEKIGSDCHEANITEVMGDGAIVKTDDGSMFEIDEIDRVDTSLWLAGTDVVVCWERYRLGGQVVTLYVLRAEGDKVDATRLR